MIFESIQIIAEELNKFLNYLSGNTDDLVMLGNISLLESNLPGVNDNGKLLNKVVITLINIEEEKTLKNLRNYKVNGTETIYKNPPQHLNIYLLISSTSTDYNNALIYLSRVVKFFQGQNVFTHKNSLSGNLPGSTLTDFKLIADLYSPTFEETSFLWSTLGGKQMPSLIYKIRLVTIERDEPVIDHTGNVITQIITDKA